MVASIKRHCEVNHPASVNLNSKHHGELVNERGLNADWVQVNCLSIDKQTASEQLGYKAYSDGILLRGAGYQEQFKPDQPWSSKDGKKPKYRSCREDDGYDAMPPIHPYNPNFWDDVEELKKHCYQINGVPYIVVTEGYFKAISLTSHGVATIAILGVEQGLTSSKRDPQGKRYLVDTLERYARAGFGFMIGFDADCARKKGVKQAQSNLAHQLSLFGAPVYSITGLWHETEGKGIDDYIQMNGYEQFRDEVLNKAETIEAWKEKHLPNLDRQFNAKAKPPKPRETAKELAEDYQNWRYHNQQKTWRYYNQKYWEKVELGVFEGTIKTEVDGRGVNYSTAKYFKDVAELLKYDLMVPHWETLGRFHYIPFENGVLEVTTRKLREHNPDDGLIHVLPHKYTPIQVDNLLEALQSNCPHTHQYMTTTQKGNERMIRKMLAAINGAITGKFAQLQQFLQLTGKTRAGKGVFTRLLTECVGKDNHTSVSIENLNCLKMKAGYIDKMLVQTPEARSISENSISALLSLTGGDQVDCRANYGDPFKQQFNGTLVITSNRQIGTTKFPELEERQCLIPFDHTVPKAKRIPNLDQLIKTEIPQLISIVLSMSDAEVTHLLRGIGEGENLAVRLHQWELKTEESVIAAFFNDALIVEHGAITRTKNLYKVFKSYCFERGKTPLHDRRFARELDELCDQMELDGVKWKKRGGGKNPSQFEGLRLRTVNDDHLTYEETLSEKIEAVPHKEEVLTAEEILLETPSAQAFPSCTSSSEKLSFIITPAERNRDSRQSDPNSCQAHNRSLIRTPFGTMDENGNYVNHKPEKSPQKPEIANLSEQQKEDWLHRYKKTDKTMWVEHPKYTGLAKPIKPSVRGEWTVEPTPEHEKVKVLHTVTLSQISIPKSQLGDKIKPIPQPPEGEQVEIDFDAVPQDETPAKRFKRLAKKQGIKLKRGDSSFDFLLEKYNHSNFKDFTDEELTEIGDIWEGQIKSVENFKDQQRITRYLEDR